MNSVINRARKLKPNVILRLFLTIFCSSGLIYQTTQLFSQYMMGTTFVTIQVERISSETLPGITICYPKLISFERTSKQNADYKKKFDEYQNQLKNSTEHGDPLINYNELASSLFRIDQGELLEKYSLDFVFTDGVRGVDINIKGVILDYNKSLINSLIINNDYDIHFFNGTPIESLSTVNHMKCFTFFSALQKEWRHLKMDLKFIQVIIKHSNNWFPYKQYKIFAPIMALHSPNNLPDLDINENNHVKLDQGQTFIDYSLVSVDRLDSSYDTNCYEYNLDYKHANFNMRSDCLSSCKHDASRTICLMTEQPSILLRKEYFQNKTFLNEEICRPYSIKIELGCKTRCKLDCKFNFYLVNYRGIAYDNELRSVVSTVRISHNNFPDVVVKHLPESTFISLVCNLGGLIGMWLGLSVLTVFNDFAQILINQFFIKKINMKNTNIIVNQTQLTIRHRANRMNRNHQGNFVRN